MYICIHIYIYIMRVYLYMYTPSSKHTKNNDIMINSGSNIQTVNNLNSHNDHNDDNSDVYIITYVYIHTCTYICYVRYM